MSEVQVANSVPFMDSRGIYNTMEMLRLYFDVSFKEFFEFWSSLTFDEMDYYRSINLDTGLPYDLIGY